MFLGAEPDLVHLKVDVKDEKPILFPCCGNQEGFREKLSALLRNVC